MDILKKENRFYLISMLIALTVCILWIIFVKTVPYSDFDYYYRLAKKIADGGSFGDTYTSVGYAIALGYGFMIFGKSILVGEIFNLVLTTISYFLMYSLLKKINVNENNKKMIFFIYVFFPANIFYNSLLATEILFTMLLLLITNIYFSKNKFKYIFIGILTGVETIIKPAFFAFFFAILLVEIIKNKKFVKPLLHALIILTFSCVIIFPMVYRNTKMMGEFTLVSNNKGMVLYINNNSQNKWGRWMPADKVQNSIVLTEKYKRVNITEKNKMLSKAAKKWIKSHPVKFVILGFKRLINTYYVGDDILFTYNGAKLSSLTQLCLLIYTNLIRNFIFLPATIGVVMYTIKVIKALFRKTSNELSSFEIYALILLYMFTGTYFITEGQGRYGFPFAFILIYFFSTAVNMPSKKFHHSISKYFYMI